MTACQNILVFDFDDLFKVIKPFEKSTVTFQTFLFPYICVNGFSVYVNVLHWLVRLYYCLSS